MIRIIVILFTFLVVHNSALNGQCDTKCYSLKPFQQDLTIDYKKTNVYTERVDFLKHQCHILLLIMVMRIVQC